MGTGLGILRKGPEVCGVPACLCVHPAGAYTERSSLYVLACVRARVRICRVTECIALVLNMRVRGCVQVHMPPHSASLSGHVQILRFNCQV